MLMALKKCKRCGVEKPVTEFYISHTSKDGYNAWCKDCTRKRSSEIYQYRKIRKEVMVSEGTCIEEQIDTIKTLYHNACIAFSKGHQQLKFIEELLEASLAFIRFKTAKDEDKTQRYSEFLEEIADVFITTIQQAKEMGDRNFVRIVASKVTKFHREINEALNTMDDLK